MIIKTKFLLLTAGIFAAFAILMVADRVSVVRRIMLERVADRADYLGAVITEITAEKLENGNLDELKSTLKGFEHFANISYLRLSDAKGGIVYNMVRPGVRVRGRIPDGDILDSPGGIYDLSRDIIWNGRQIGTVQFGMSLAGVHESLEALLWRGIAVGFFFLLLLGGAVWAFVFRLLKQLDALRALAERMNSETLPPEPQPDIRTETGSIAFVMREMHAHIAEEKKLRVEAETRKDDFFAMTVHDLKQPLTTLKVALDMLLPEDEKKNYTKDQVRGFSKVAATSLKMLNSMVVDVLNMAKLNSRDYAPAKTRIPLAGFMRDCAEENSMVVTAANKKWSFSLPEDTGNAWIFGDYDMIKRCVGNLILNAVQYTPEGGAIKLGLRLASPDKAAIYVSDEGEGIPDNFREEIFKKYQGLGKSSKNVGIGLAFCKMVADNHAGAMAVKSEAGKGTEMSLLLPVSRGGGLKLADEDGKDEHAGKK